MGPKDLKHLPKNDPHGGGLRADFGAQNLPTADFSCGQNCPDHVDLKLNKQQIINKTTLHS